MKLKAFRRKERVIPTYRYRTIMSLQYKDRTSAIAFYILAQMSDVDVAKLMGEEVIG